MPLAWSFAIFEPNRGVETTPPSRWESRSRISKEGGIERLYCIGLLPTALQLFPGLHDPKLRQLRHADHGLDPLPRSTLSRVIQFGIPIRKLKHHSTLYRFFSRASWVGDALSQILVGLVLPWVGGGLIFVVVDDTLCPKSGPHVWGAGMHHDPLRSTYGRGTSAGRQVRFRFGHNWVVLCLWVPLPWNPEKGLALPVMWRLYRSKKRCPAGQYRKRTELAAEMVRIVVPWLPSTRQVVLVGDTEYACHTLVRDLPIRLGFAGPMTMTAALYALPDRRPGAGRPRSKGPRIPSPSQLIDDPSVPWQRLRVRLYEDDVDLWVKTQVGLWYRVAGPRRVRVVVTRDPQGRLENRAYFATNLGWSVAEILQAMARRWPQEVLHRDAKQFLGLEDPQNGWWRRLARQRAGKKKPGPQPHATRGRRAAERTTPMAFVAYSLVVVWYFGNCHVHEDLSWAKRLAPWYRHKVDPCFSDMLSALRREMLRQRISQTPALQTVLPEILELMEPWAHAA